MSYTGKYRKGYRAERIRQRQEEADERQAYRNQLSPEEQIKALDKRLGKGKGAKKERKRLAAKIKET